MPAAQLLAAGLETLANALLSLDDKSQQRLTALSGKSLKVTLNELPWPLTLVFSNQIDVQVNSEGSADCDIALSIATLDKLKDSSQISQLIKENSLILEGDINIAQQFSALIRELNIDWEEQLSAYTGDVVAHQVFKIGQDFHKGMLSNIDKLGKILSEGAMEEKQIAAHPLAVEDFSHKVNELRADVARIEAKIATLEE